MTARPEIDRLIDRCEPFRRALDEYQVAFAADDRDAMAKIWERASAAAQSFWAAERSKREAA